MTRPCALRPLQTLAWNVNPKERLARAAFQYTAVGVYTATCNVNYTCWSATATLPINFQVTVLP